MVSFFKEGIVKRKGLLLCAGLSAVMLFTSVPAAAFAQEPAAGPAAEQRSGNVIPDAGLQKIINQTLNGKLDTDREDNAPVTSEDMEELTSLVIESGDGVEDLDGLRYAVNLTSLRVYGDITGLEEIGYLEKLESLSVNRNSNLETLSVFGDKPALEDLDCSNNGNLSDISALSNHACPALREVTLENCSEITDITPLKGYSGLEYLNLEKITVTEENREDYQETIRSLTGLRTLYMPYCEVTDEDTGMFSALADLETLVLNMNNITSTQFCADLPETLQQLSLHGNDISDMSNISRFSGLTLLGLGNNNVTDFSFIGELPELTAGSLRHAEGTQGFSAVETYYYGSQSEPVETEDGRLVIENPYIGPDGRPVSFAGAEVSYSDSEDCQVSYDGQTNEIILTQVKGSATVTLDYDLPVGTEGDYKVCSLRIRVYTEENEQYTINYDWGTEAPEGQRLPSDTNVYDSLEAAQAAVDKTFTGQTVVQGTKDGKEGTWKFSGWTVSAGNGVLQVTGYWSFEEHQHVWGAPSYTWSEDGKTCTARRVCGADDRHVEEETADVTARVTTEATCTAMGSTTYTAVFESEWAQTQTLVKQDVAVLPHTPGADWKYDDQNHWKECAACGTRLDEGTHSLEWVIDREASGTESGLKHQECTECGYRLPDVVIPADEAAPGGDPTPDNEAVPDKEDEPEVQPPAVQGQTAVKETASPRTGDLTDFMPWICLGTGAALCLICGVLAKKFKKIK